MWRLLEIGEAPKIGDEWWYQEDVVFGGYWAPVLGPLEHIKVGSVVIRRKISESDESCQQPTTYVKATADDMAAHACAQYKYGYSCYFNGTRKCGSMACNTIPRIRHFSPSQPPIAPTP